MTNAGIEINGRHSYRTFGLYLKSRKIGTPARKMVTATVPYMNGYYDFSGLYGEPAYESRELTYTFDILEDSPEDAESAKNAVVAWAMEALASKIYDDDDPDWYFEASYESAEYEEDSEVPEMGGELTLKFLAQPYRWNRTTGERVVG